MVYFIYGDMIPMEMIDDRFVKKTHEDFDEKEKIMMSKNVKARTT